MMQKPKVQGLTNVFLPAISEADSPSKLLLVLHGLGDSLDGFRFLPETLRLPNVNYLLLNAPDRYFTGYSWFDIPGDIKPGVTRSRQLLFSALDQIESQGWNLKDVGVLGFSQGCLMAIDLACRYPKELGAIVGISGYAAFLETYPEEFSPVARKQKILVTHGDADEMIPISHAKPEFLALKGMGLNLEWREYRKTHTIDPYQEIDDIKRFFLRTLSSDLPPSSR